MSTLFFHSTNCSSLSLSFILFFMRTRTGDLESRQDLAYFVSIHFTSFRCLSLLLAEWPMNAISGWLTSQRPWCMATDRRGWTRHNLLAVRRKEWVKPTERKPYSIKEWEGGVPTKSCYVAEKFTPVCLLDFLFDFSSFSKGQEDVQIICVFRTLSVSTSK